MIARHRKDGSRIVAERIVELVVIRLRFAEAVDDVSQMVEKRWNVGRIDAVCALFLGRLPLHRRKSAANHRLPNPVGPAYHGLASEARSTAMA